MERKKNSLFLLHLLSFFGFANGIDEMVVLIPSRSSMLNNNFLDLSFHTQLLHNSSLFFLSQWTYIPPPWNLANWTLKFLPLFEKTNLYQWCSLYPECRGIANHQPPQTISRVLNTYVFFSLSLSPIAALLSWVLASTTSSFLFATSRFPFFFVFSENDDSLCS